MVITVTLNPAMDKTLTINNFALGVVNRVDEIRHDIGGKGINVSKVLKNFEVESVCTGFIGGMWQNTFVEEINSRGIKENFTRINENTRTNTKIIDAVNNCYTDINEAGPNISKREIDSFIETYKGLCKKDDIVVLGGGVSPSLPKDIYAQLIKIAKEAGATVILDADGELLEAGLKEKPHIIKPNEHEISKIFNMENSSIDEIKNAAQQLVKEGIKKVMVSLGENGSILVTSEGIFYAEGLVVPVKSTVGAGDSMVAAMVYSLINNYSEIETLRFANACGAASVSTEGTEACTLDQVKELLSKVKVTKVE